MVETATVIEIGGCQLIPAKWPVDSELIKEVFARHDVQIKDHFTLPCFRTEFDEMLEENWSWYTIERPGAITWCTALEDRMFGEWWFRDQDGVITLDYAAAPECAFREYLRRRGVTGNGISG